MAIWHSEEKANEKSLQSSLFSKKDSTTLDVLYAMLNVFSSSMTLINYFKGVLLLKQNKKSNNKSPGHRVFSLPHPSIFHMIALGLFEDIWESSGYKLWVVLSTGQFIILIFFHAKSCCALSPSPLLLGRYHIPRSLGSELSKPEFHVVKFPHHLREIWYNSIFPTSQLIIT